MDESLNLKELAKHLSIVFPGLVTTSEEAGVITVMERIKVTSKGVAEGSGPAAERVKAVYEEYMNQRSIEGNETISSLSPNEATKARNPFRCQHCGLRLTSGRVYRRTIGSSVMLFCCKQCADHHETESIKIGMK